MQRLESCSCTEASTRKKSARSRSSMFTKTTRESSSSSARSQTREVLTSTPITPETTTSAPSTTRSEATVSAWKPESPGVSIRFSLRPCHSQLQSDAESDIGAALLVLFPVGDGAARLDRAQPVRLSRLEEQGLDERGLPRTAMADDGDVADLPGFDGHRVLLRCGCAESYAVTAEAARTRTRPARHTAVKDGCDDAGEPRHAAVGAGEHAVQRGERPDGERQVVRLAPDGVRQLLAEEVRQPDGRHQLGGGHAEPDRERPVRAT